MFWDRVSQGWNVQLFSRGCWKAAWMKEKKKKLSQLCVQLHSGSDTEFLKMCFTKCQFHELLFDKQIPGPKIWVKLWVASPMWRPTV